MSLKAHLWALDAAPVKNPTAVLVLVALSDEASDDGEGACPYMHKVVQRARCSERSAQNHLRDLYRARIIDFGDPVVAQRRYRRSGGRCPRVWNLNLSATWDNMPEPRTDDEMLAYSDQIGMRPARRGVQDLHPSETADQDDLGGVQNLHPSEEQAADQAKEADIDSCFDDRTNTDLHPWGADSCTPGVQTAAPYPLVSACTRPNSPPVLDQPLEGQAEESGGGIAPQEKNPTLSEVARWFARMRNDFAVADIEAALTVAMAERQVSLTTAAQGLRELLSNVDRYGKTKTPYRLSLDHGWWKAVAPKTAAARERLAAEPRCQQPGHGPYPAGRCVPCMTDQYAPDEIKPDPAADAKAAEYTKAVRERQAAGIPPVGRQGGRKTPQAETQAAAS